MAGGWVGYLYVFFGCGVVCALLLGSTLALYAVARVQKRARPEPRVRVLSVSSGPDEHDAP